MHLPNRSVNGVTTSTGHTLRNNPFGQINVVGTNGTMLVQIFKDGKEYYDWLFLIDLNLAYWSGNINSASYTIETDLAGAAGKLNTDLNNDGQTNSDDFKILLRNWGTDFSIPAADLNNDRVVNSIDLEIMKREMKK